MDPTADGSGEIGQPVAGRQGTAGGADVARGADVGSSSARDAFMRLLHSVRVSESDDDLDRVLASCPSAVGRMELNGILAKVEVRCRYAGCFPFCRSMAERVEGHVPESVWRVR